jgi:hypothetical protein
MKCPASGKPAAVGQRVLSWHIWWKIPERNVAYCCIHIPLKHRVDRFSELCTARFVDTTCIDPRKSQAMFQCQVTSLCDLGIAFLQGSVGQGHVLKSDLAVTPCVRENRVWWDFRQVKVVKV